MPTNIGLLIPKGIHTPHIHDCDAWRTVQLVEECYTARMTGRLDFILAVLTAGSGCSQGVDLQAINPNSVTDTSGATFNWSCSQSECTTSAGPTTSPPATCGDEPAAYNYSWARFVSICTVYKSSISGVSWSTFPELCRILSCQADDECPQLDGYTYTCIHGLCQDPTAEPERIIYGEAVALCLDSTPRASNCAQARSDPRAQTVSMLLSQVCTTDCQLSLPSSCHQP
jgi:hypothetical protein